MARLNNYKQLTVACNTSIKINCYETLSGRIF